MSLTRVQQIAAELEAAILNFQQVVVESTMLDQAERALLVARIDSSTRTLHRLRQLLPEGK